MRGGCYGSAPDPPERRRAEVEPLLPDRVEVALDRARALLLPAELEHDWPPDPEWYPLMKEEPNDCEGEILASFELVPAKCTRGRTRGA